MTLREVGDPFGLQRFVDAQDGGGTYDQALRSVPARIKDISKNDVANAMNKMFEQKIGGIGVLGGADSAVVDKLQAQLESLWR